ncbi:purple acid phosphatase family protein [Dyadobacter chenhuakuii]|uniref:Metallophosphoesterase family protein n=1 Tax=Dyadobacter chenhuakuii TaxID=2909339 RepID=A0A9X1QIH4_9BACT|nr:metallophosphoesterase family protein [Dyadobacter chenhuakuii]MCF2501087.1 metallophosphoesterase family protein [Dyadobacter chenhuakuii]
MQKSYLRTILLAACFAALFTGCNKSNELPSGTVKEVIDNLVTKLYRTLPPTQLDTISNEYILRLLTDKDKEILSKKFWTFDVNVPVIVSLMRDRDQEVVPFWIEASGFKLTQFQVKNDEYEYEVWQKEFPAGQVGLGINGFDKHRPVYFITVAPQNEKDKLKITNVNPRYALGVMDLNEFTYHDWDELKLKFLSVELKDQVLFTTVRGRAREAHLVNAFRTTDTPSSTKPDQVVLTWSGDPKTTMDIQWRTSPEVKSGKVKYWEKGGIDTFYVDASVFKMEDRLLRNDRFVNRFTANLNYLDAGQAYQYVLASKSGWSQPAEFTTAPLNEEDFSFIWFGDTHHSEAWGDMAKKSLKRHPETAFFSVVGDLVTTGLHRDEWDKLWDYSDSVFTGKPLMPVPGNHDSQDGLGAWMYKEMFSLPDNGPKKQPSEMTYAFNYEHALFLMMDATLPIHAQTAWMEQQLKNSDAKWKFVMLHFPPYNYDNSYDEIIKEWCSLFDKYHVDMVMSGHMHYYLRTKPMFNEQPVSSPAKGTIYTVSIGIPGELEYWLAEEYAAVRMKEGPLYQHIAIKGNTLSYKCYDPDGNVKDQLVIKK